MGHLEQSQVPSPPTSREVQEDIVDRPTDLSPIFQPALSLLYLLDMLRSVKTLTQKPGLKEV